ncbi:MAG: AAA family ATPase, partial [Alphaproteobacteria bacterium]|nr:AAA family ATPase [Alphaproteobacteria bacterium]
MSAEDQVAPSPSPQATRISTGISGLDGILGGGLMPGRLYLVEGTPGAGKTTLGLQFLLEGRSRGERGLFITLSETNEELEAVAASHGWSLDGINFFELTSAENLSSPERELTLLHPWEVELGEMIKLITDQAESIAPTRVVFDSVSEMRLLAEEPLRFRRQVLALKQFFAARKATVLLLEELPLNSNGRDLQLLSLSHGVIRLERWTPDYGGARRQIEITKMRGAASREGWHDYKMRTGGIEVFPTLIAAEHMVPFIGEPVSSGLGEIDAVLDGGPLRGTCTLLTGPAGSGKSTLILQYICAAAARGEHCAVYEFEERIGTMLVRAAKLGLDLDTYVQTGLVTLRQVDPAQIAPGEFAHLIRKEVEENGARLVVIDSLNGYLSSMPQESQLVLQLHELLAYLNQQGVLTLLVNPQHGVVGSLQSSL